MGTRAGFFLFVGLIAGAVLGIWLPYAASFETIGGGVLGLVVGFAVDALNPAKARRGDD